MNTKVAKKNNKGFTLIELILVIAIIAVLATILAPQYLRYVEKSRISVNCQSAAEILSATKTACADEAVYDALGTGDTTVTWANTGAIAVSPASNTNLTNEILKTVTGNATKATVARKSKTLQAKGTFTVTITPNTTDSTVSVTGAWSGTGDDDNLTKKSGGTTTSNNAGGQKPAGK